MSKNHRIAFLVAVVAVAVFGAAAFRTPVAQAVTLSGGDLIKLPDDGDPNTSADTAVYYYGPDAKRYAFPNSRVYFSWYKDFSGIKIVTAAEMAAIRLGGNITYRPGTRLVKIISNPSVYAVEPGGVLRQIQSEAVAKSLYGDAWNKRVDDVPDAYFVNYRYGDPLSAAVYPSGTIVKRTTDNAYFRIEDRTKRRIVSAAVLTGLRIQDKDVLTAANLDSYSDGPDIAAADTAWTDAAQKSQTTAAAVPTFSVRAPASTFIPVGGSVTLLELHLSSAKPVMVRRFAVRIDATLNKDKDSMDSPGGLVYGNNAQTGVRLIRFVDSQGNDVTNRQDAAVDVSRDKSQDFVLTGSAPVSGSGEAVYYLKAQINPLIPTGEGYKASLLVNGTEVVDSSTGSLVSFLPATDLAGTVLTTLNDALEVSASSIPGNKTYVRGSKNAELGGLTFKATTAAPNVIKSATFQLFYDNEQVGGFVAGGDGDSGLETRAYTLVPQVNLYDTKGVKIAGPVPVALDGRATFSGLTISIPAGQSTTLVLRGDLNPAIELGSKPDLVSVDMNDAASDITLTDDRGQPVMARGKWPNGGPAAIFSTTVKQNGKIKFNWDGAGGSAYGGEEIKLGTLSMDTDDDSYVMSTVSFRHKDVPPKSVVEVRLEFTGVDGKVASVTKSLLSTGNVTFTGLAVPLKRDVVTSVTLYGKLLTKDSGAVYGEKIAFLFSPSDALGFVSDSDGHVFSEKDLGTSDFGVDRNNPSTYIVHWSKLTVAKADGVVGTVYHERETEVLRFTMKADAHGAVRVKKLVFAVTPGDAGSRPGPRTDTLEQWSFVNGDFANDFGVAKLVRWYSSDNKETIGEGTSRLQYSFVHNGQRITNPAAQNITSSKGDYGIIEIVLNDGSEVFIPAGVTHQFRFYVDAGWFNNDSKYDLKAELLGANDFQWTDIVSGTYTALVGTDAAGLPISNTVQVQP